jgi:hypothetical protein
VENWHPLTKGAKANSETRAHLGPIFSAFAA